MSLAHSGAGLGPVLMKAQPVSGGMALTQRPVRAPASHEVLVKIHRAAICGTDLHLVGWNAWAAARYTPPFALGHEFSGEVLAVGADVRDVAVGNLVTAETHLPCGQCEQCHMGRGHTCLNLQVFSRLDCGAFARFVTLPGALVRVLPSHVPHKHACLMEPLGIAVRAVQESSVGEGDLLIVGCGPIGLLAIAAARALGVGNVLAADVQPGRLALAERLGATAAINPVHEALPTAVQRVLGRAGVDAAIDASGSGPGMQAALQSIRPGGTLLLAGMPDAAMEIDLTRHIILREIALKGIYGRRINSTWEEALRLLSVLGPMLDTIVTHEFALEDYEEAFNTAMSGQGGKVEFVL